MSVALRFLLRVLCSVFVVAGLALPVHASSREWENINPPGVSLDRNTPPENYGFNTIVVDPSRPGTIYMGTNYQGIYKSIDRGDSWIKIDTGDGSNMVDGGRAWALAIDPFNPSTLYAASGYGFGGPLKSIDAGVSWTHLLPPAAAIVRQVGTNDIYNVALDPFTPNHVLVSWHYFWSGTSDSGVVESIDGGLSWSVHAPPAGSGWGPGNSVWFLDNSHTWLLGSQNAGFWRTSDGGQTWTRVSASNIAHGGIYSLYRNATTGVLYTAIWNGVMKSTDDGITWQTWVDGLPYAAYQALGGDGVNLYTAQEANPASAPWYTLSENGGTQWTAYPGPQPCTNGFCDGPVQLAFDAATHTLYSVNWNAGVWRLQTDDT